MPKKISFWHHRGHWNNTDHTASLLIDEVHLNNTGMQFYAKNVRAAVGSSKRK